MNLLKYEELEASGFDMLQINQLMKIQKRNCDVSQLSNDISLDTLRFLLNFSEIQNPEELKKYAEVFEENIEKEIFFSGLQYHEEQITQILDAKREGLDFKKLLNPEIPPDVMGKIRSCLKYGISIDYLLANCSKLSRKQMEYYISVSRTYPYYDADALYKKGYEPSAVNEVAKYKEGHGVDITEYLLKQKGRFDMDQIRSMIELLWDAQVERLKDNKVDLDYIFQTGHTAGVMEKLYEMANNGFDIKSLSKHYRQSLGCLNVIYLMYSRGYDYNHCLDKDFSPAQLNEIFNGMVVHVDYKKYAKQEYSSATMSFLLKQLKYNDAHPENKVDIDFLLKNCTKDYQALTHVTKVMKCGTLEEKIKIYKEYGEDFGEHIEDNKEKEATR